MTTLTAGEQQVLTVLVDFLPDYKTLDALLAYREDGASQPALRLMTRASLARTLGALQRKGMTSKISKRGQAVYKIMPHGIRTLAEVTDPVPPVIKYWLALAGGQQPEQPADWAGREPWTANGTPAPICCQRYGPQHDAAFSVPGCLVPRSEITVRAELIKLAEGERVSTIYDVPGASPILAIGITTLGHLLYGVRAGKGWAFEPQWIGRIGSHPSQLQDVLEQIAAEQHVIDRPRYPSAMRLAMRDVLLEGPRTLAEIEAAYPSMERRAMIAELARMRDDGIVEFQGPRYKMIKDPVNPVAD
jgi:DNA-binding HxlR family transcriptional regulator